jgi:hypothetical protein
MFPDDTTSALSCPDKDQMPFPGPDKVQADAVSEAYIRSVVPGILSGDELSAAWVDSPWNNVLAYKVQRDGETLAFIGATTLQGIACRGSGIGGV